MESVQNVLTGFDYDTEDAALDHLDAIIHGSVGRVAFSKAYSEVDGELIQPRYGLMRNDGREAKPLRIDRILVPSKALITAGWHGGLIGVEGKRSNEKIGKPISQSLDYARAVFELPDCHVLVMLQWIFLWPLRGAPIGDVGSVMAQNRIGWVFSSNRTPLAFGCGGTIGIRLESDGTIEVKELPMGRKAGNRG